MPVKCLPCYNPTPCTLALSLRLWYLNQCHQSVQNVQFRCIKLFFCPYTLWLKLYKSVCYFNDRAILWYHLQNHLCPLYSPHPRPPVGNAKHSCNSIGALICINIIQINGAFNICLTTVLQLIFINYIFLSFSDLMLCNNPQGDNIEIYFKVIESKLIEPIAFLYYPCLSITSVLLLWLQEPLQ